MEDASISNRKEAAGAAVCFMLDVSPSWSPETIALLLNKVLASESSTTKDEKKATRAIDDASSDGSEHACRPGEVAIRMLNKKEDGILAASILFSSCQELEETISLYGGLPIPMTHGYHHYSFTRKMPTKCDGSLSIGHGPHRMLMEKTTCDDGGSCDHEVPHESSSPPLHLQLLALSTTELKRRLERFEHGEAIPDNSMNDKKKSGGRRERVHWHAYFACRLTKELGNQRSAIHDVKGVPLDPTVTEPLLSYLRSDKARALWPSQSKQRKGVQSGRYLTIRKKSRSHAQDELWNLCLTLIMSVFCPSPMSSTATQKGVDESALSDAPYTALAITHSFCGSPHVDAHDVTYQHVVALGDFEGGRLCVDHDGFNDENSCIRIDVRNRLGRLDGRNVHWVEGWKGERYSVVYYSTDKKHYTDPVDQSTHNSWMVEGCRGKISN